jgi:hypothetical protein
MPKAMISLLIALAASSPVNSQEADSSLFSEETDFSPIKYAIYSTAWGESSNAGLRVVAQNMSDHTVFLDSILFESEDSTAVSNTFEIDLTVPPHGWAETAFDYQDLLFGDECVERTMTEDWKLVEISNYTLNPSVRGLIIQDSDSFRIYQCVRSVFVTLKDLDTQEDKSFYEWIMYHFERKLTY